MKKFYVIITSLKPGDGLELEDERVVATDHNAAISQALARHHDFKDTDVLIACAVTEDKAKFLERLAKN